MMKKTGLVIIALLIALPVFAQDQTISTDNVSLVDIQEASKKIREKEKELVAKEQELNAREESLKALEKDLITREEDLKKIRAEISAQMDQLSTSNNAELDKLAKLYSSTKPKSAASVLIKTDVDKSAAIMRRISAMTAGKIMAEIAKQDPDYASKLTVTLSGENPKNMIDNSSATVTGSMAQ